MRVALGGLFGHLRGEVTTGLHNEGLNNLHSSQNIIRIIK
jgi:hypothetical protein